MRREAGGVWVRDAHGCVERFDDVVIAAHADEAQAMLDDASAEERAMLGAFRYTKNRAVLHTDRTLMPRRVVERSSSSCRSRSNACGERCASVMMCRVPPVSLAYSFDKSRDFLRS